LLYTQKNSKTQNIVVVDPKKSMGWVGQNVTMALPCHPQVVVSGVVGAEQDAKPASRERSETSKMTFCAS
jgi:hypothetical protein